MASNLTSHLRTIPALLMSSGTWAIQINLNAYKFEFECPNKSYLRKIGEKVKRQTSNLNAKHRHKVVI